jgi:hypothetical protein
MRLCRSRALVFCLALAAPAGALAQDVSPDFLLSILRFGIECKRPNAPRNTYLGDETRLAVSVEQQSPAAADGTKSANRVTYRAFYRDLIEPDARENTVVLRCRAEAKCITAYRTGATERVSTLRLQTCSPRTAMLVSSAAKQFVESGAR